LKRREKRFRESKFKKIRADLEREHGVEDSRKVVLVPTALVLPPSFQFSTLLAGNGSKKPNSPLVSHAGELRRNRNLKGESAMKRKIVEDCWELAGVGSTWGLLVLTGRFAPRHPCARCSMETIFEKEMLGRTSKASGGVYLRGFRQRKKRTREKERKKTRKPSGWWRRGEFWCGIGGY